MPDHAIPPALPPKLPAAKTQVEPFELRVDKRGEIRNRTFSAKVQCHHGQSHTVNDLFQVHVYSPFTRCVEAMYHM